MPVGGSAPAIPLDVPVRRQVLSRVPVLCGLIQLLLFLRQELFDFRPALLLGAQLLCQFCQFDQMGIDRIQQCLGMGTE